MKKNGTDRALRDEILSLFEASRPKGESRLLFSDTLGEEYGWEKALIKDETQRLSLGSFKALGGAYAAARLVMHEIAKITGRPAMPQDLMSDLGRITAAKMTFVCASAGNHGLSVAAGSRWLGAAAIVYLSASVPKSYERRLKMEGATTMRRGDVYEDSMVAAMEDAQAIEGWHLLADSSWEGYTYIPELIMQGYETMADELAHDFEKQDCWPTHVALQGGVGGLAGAMTRAIRASWPKQPEIIIVEPDRAPCLKASVEAGQMMKSDGPVSNMGRLDCKEPSMLAFNILREQADHFVTITDEQAQQTADILTDNGLATTPSGAAALAGLVNMDLSPSSRPLFIVTEGVE